MNIDTNVGGPGQEASTHRSLAQRGITIFSQIVMPSIAHIKQMTQFGEKKRLLREIKSATIEKLTNKIIRSFALEVAFCTPFMLLICLQYR